MNTTICIVINLIWTIVVIVLGILAFYYFNRKAQLNKEMALAEQKHELDLKNVAFDQEKFWFFLHNDITVEEYKKKIEDCEEKLKAIENKEKELNDGIDNLKKEKEDFEKTILREKVKAYQDILKSIG